MQTTQYPVWKSVLWFLGTVTYGLAATGLSAFLALNIAGTPFISFLDSALKGVFVGPKLAIYTVLDCAIGGLWVGLLAVAAWHVTVRRHKTAGRILAVMAGIAAVVSLYYWSWMQTDKWWLGYVGVSNPVRTLDICEDWGNGACAGYYAKETAEAPHPPAWLPWGH